MKKLNLITAALLSSIIATSASAAVLEVRQEYLPKADDFNPVNQNSTLVKIGGNVDNTFFAVQVVNKGEHIYTYALSSTELQLGYRYDINEQHRLIPKIDFLSTSSGMYYKPQLALRSNWGEYFFTELKYKHEYAVPQDETKDITQKSQYQVKFGYQPTSALTLQLEYNYHKGLDGQKYYNYHDFKQEYEFKTFYRVAPGITPYISFAGVPVGSTKDDYQLRYRLGLLYRF